MVRSFPVFSCFAYLISTFFTLLTLCSGWKSVSVTSAEVAVKFTNQRALWLPLCLVVSWPLLPPPPLSKSSSLQPRILLSLGSPLFIPSVLLSVNKLLFSTLESNHFLMLFTSSLFFGFVAYAIQVPGLSAWRDWTYWKQGKLCCSSRYQMPLWPSTSSIDAPSFNNTLQEKSLLPFQSSWTSWSANDCRDVLVEDSSARLLGSLK